MERPSSRAGTASVTGGMQKAPTGGSIPMPDRPTTGMRTGTAMGLPPGTAMRGPAGGSIIGAPPGTAMRGPTAGAPPGTAYKRAGTAQGARPGTGATAAGAPPRTGAPVQVDNRPITNHGVSGMRTGAATTAGHGGRQVLDKAYFMNELRQKRSEILAITQQMKADLELQEKRQAQYTTYDKRGNELSKVVKELQEQLADYNTVLDKVGSQTPVYAINAEYAALKERNDQQRKRIDDILTERLTLEQKTKQAENKMMAIQQEMDARLNSMPPSQRQQYYDLVNEQQTLQAELKRFEETMEQLDNQLSTSEGEMARNPLKQKSLQLQEQIRVLTEKKYELQQEEERSKMSPEEQREQLMAKIKRDNAEVEQMTNQIRDLQDQIKKMEARLSSLGGQGAISNAAEEENRRKKFEELLAKERDLNNFMDSFPSRKAAKLQEKEAKEDNIVALLEKVNKLQAMAGTALPSQKKFKEMQDELEYKKLQLENTQMTQDRLKDELNMRRTELDKIDTLEDKIKQELEQLAEKSELLKKNITTYANVAEVKRKAEATRERLEGLRTDLLQRKDTLKSVVLDKALKLQAKKAQLQENNLQMSLEKLEQKLRQIMGNVWQMDEFIKMKESETNYKTLAAQINSMCDELNGNLKKAFS